MLPIILAAVGTYLIADSQKQKFAKGGSITSARITKMPEEFGDEMPQVYVLVDGQEEFLFDYYPDEISFKPEEFIGLTKEEAKHLKFEKDKNYLMYSNAEVEFAKGGKIDDGQANFGKPPIPYDEIPFIHETSVENAKKIVENGFKKSPNQFITNGVYTIPIVWKNEKFDSRKNTQELMIWLKEGSKIFWTNSTKPTDYYTGYGNKFYQKLYTDLNKGHKTPKDDFNDKNSQASFSRRMENWLKDNGYVGVQQGGEIVITDINAIESVDFFER